MRLIDAFDKGSLSAKQYCEEHHLVLQTFHARRSDIKQAVSSHQSKLVKVKRETRIGSNNSGRKMPQCLMMLNPRWYAQTFMNLPNLQVFRLTTCG